ncbi:MAG TPA: alpha/beta hydrolase [Candidatus Acidoferrum sp.]|nr:alpha/beta hydrolase [Candidatus Acidoferrum sp.]
MILTAAFLILALLAAFFACRAAWFSARLALFAVLHRPLAPPLARLLSAFALTCVWASCAAAVVFASQMAAKTPPIKDHTGATPENGISELIAVELNGRKQWLSIRGYDASKPVLLFLAGGPGGSQLAALRHELPALERDFVVVGWDQPGSAKSYGAVPPEGLTPETYVEDGLALTEYLKARFSKEKIYLMGESWGSALGIFLIERDPASYHAFIGTGQMVAFLETERIDYAAAMELAKAAGDGKTVQKLTDNGPPPYSGKDVTMKSAVYLNYLTAAMNRNPAIYNPGYQTLRDLFSPEYGIYDKINFVRGVLSTFGEVYPQLYPVDLREDYTKLEVPVYFFLGRHDLNAPPALAQQYFDALEVPEKELVWFEHSGHSPWINEADLFAQEVLRCFS